MPPGIISLLRVGTNSALINSEKVTTEHNGPHFSEFGRLNLTLNLEIHQHLGSLKYMINIIMWTGSMHLKLCSVGEALGVRPHFFVFVFELWLWG
jgi:hypothetical protein